jgi:hypothetical protein
MYHDVIHVSHVVRDNDSTPPPSEGNGASEGDGADETRDGKKERVLHTRIPAVLEAELKAAAAALRVPVSNLVRTILEDAVAVADRATGHVENSLERAARSVAAERERLRTRVRRLDPLADVVAYQPLIIAALSHCAKCNAVLEPGEDAALGVTSRPGPKIFVCRSCMPRRSKN